MKRTKSLVKLSHEHNAALMLALGLKKNAPNLKSVPIEVEDKAEFAKSFFNTDLVNHFREEEEVLFPFISGKNEEIDKIIPELLDEHRTLAQMFLSIDKYKITRDELASIGDLLRMHIRKEERYLFELIQQHFSDEELDTILSRHE